MTSSTTPGVPVKNQHFADLFDKKKSDTLLLFTATTAPSISSWEQTFPSGGFISSPKPNCRCSGVIKENLHKGFICPSTSLVEAPISLVTKKEGFLQPCVDYHVLTKITIQNQYPSLLINELFENLCSAKVFTKLDLSGAYNLMRLQEGDEWKTAFHTKCSHFKYLVMLFGLCNALVNF